MISIIIPTLNEEKLLPGLLSQIFEPGLKKRHDYEVIVSDGGSKDNTVKIAESFGCTVLLQSDDEIKNISSGRNLGAKAAKGDILFFITADLLFEYPDAIFSFVEDEFRQSAFGAMTCFVKTFPQEEKLQDRLFQNFYNNYFYLINKLGIGMGRGECQIIRKSVFDSTGGYLTHLAAGEDFDLFRRIARGHKILFSRKFVVFESPRRYRKYGYFNVAKSWTVNAISILRFNKSNSSTWEAIR